MKNALVIWRLAIVRCALFSFVTLGVAWQTATQAIDFGSMHGWEKFSLFVGIFVLWGNQMLSFLDKTAATINSGRPPIGSTDFLSKQQIENG